MRTLLIKSPPFSTLSSSKLDKLAKSCDELAYSKGDTIFHEGDVASWVWVIKKGWVRLTKTAFREKSVTIDLLTPREAICGISVFDHLPYSATAEAATDCVMVRIPSKEVMQLFQTEPRFPQDLLAICCHRIRHMAEACAMLYEPAPRRIAKVLLHLREAFGPVLPITHSEIAGIAGLRVETTIRMMARMKKQKWIAISRGKVELVRAEKIRELWNDAA